MSSDPKGPTPLSYEERMDATIDAQATEIAILKDGRCVSCMEPVNPLHPKCSCIRAELTELQHEIEDYRQALEKYGTHRSGCTWWKAYSNKPECSCGFARVLAGKEAQG